jgi:hypothetical protein
VLAWPYKDNYMQKAKEKSPKLFIGFGLLLIFILAGSYFKLYALGF